MGLGRLIVGLSAADLAGKGWSLDQGKDTKGTVIAFTSATCAVTKKYALSLRVWRRSFEHGALHSCS